MRCVQPVTQRQCVLGGGLGLWGLLLAWVQIPSSALPQKKPKALCGQETDQGPPWLPAGETEAGRMELSWALSTQCRPAYELPAPHPMPWAWHIQHAR